MTMAQYNVTYVCGHQGTVNLYGKHSERDRKLDWLATVNCCKCNIAAHDDDPIRFELAPYSMATDDNGYPLMQLILTGGTRPRKDEIRELGYRWDDIEKGGLSLLSCDAPPKGWVKVVGFDQAAIASAVKNTCETLGLPYPDLTVDPISLALAREQVAKADARKAKLAELVKPERPACHPLRQHPDAKRWNGKIYGRSGNYNYYVNDTRYSVTDDEKLEIEAYQERLQTYRKNVEAIKNG